MAGVNYCLGTTRANESSPGEAVNPVQSTASTQPEKGKTMATFVHPVTGVTLNIISVFRSSLGDAEAETVRLLRREGYKVQEIAAMLGTNQGRVCEILGLKKRRDGGSDENGGGQPLLF